MRERRNGIIINYLQTLVSLGVSLLYVPVLLKFLGKSEYGLYQMVGSFFSFIIIFKSSISNGVLKYYCKAKVGGNQLEMENILANARIIYRILALIMITVSSFIIVIYRKFYASSLSGHEIYEGTWMLVILFIDLIISVSNSIYLAGIFAFEKFTFDRIITLIVQILQPVLCLLVVARFPYGIVIMLIQLALNIAIAFLKYWYAKTNLKIKVILHNFDKELAKSILLLAGNILFSNLADQIFWKTDQLVLGKKYNTETIAVYSIAMQINNCYLNLGIVVSSVFFPMLSKLNNEQERIKKMSNIFIKIGRCAYLLLLLVLSGFMIFGREFILLWVGEGYEMVYSIALMVMIPFTIDIIQHLGIPILQIIDRYSFRARIYLLAAILNVGLTIIMVDKVGMYGAALSTGIALIITSGIIMNIYYCKYIGIDIVKFWKNIIIITGKTLTIIVISYLINCKIKLHTGWGSFVLKIIIYVMVYVIWSYFFVFNSFEKGIFRFIRKKIDT